MKHLLTSFKIEEESLKKLPFKLELQKSQLWYLYTDADTGIFIDCVYTGVTEGYLRNLDLSNSDMESHTLSCFNYIAEKWPFANIDIINAAALNIELDLIYSEANQNLKVIKSKNG